MFNERRQPSRGGTSRMTRECQVRFCEGLGVKFPGPTRHFLPPSFAADGGRCSSLSGRRACFTALSWLREQVRKLYRSAA